MYTKIIIKRQGQIIHWQYINSVYKSPVFYNPKLITADPKAVICETIVHLTKAEFWQAIEKDERNENKSH